MNNATDDHRRKETAHVWVWKLNLQRSCVEGGVPHRQAGDLHPREVNSGRSGWYSHCPQNTIWIQEQENSVFTLMKFCKAEISQKPQQAYSSELFNCASRKPAFSAVALAAVSCWAVIICPRGRRRNYSGLVFMFTHPTYYPIPPVPCTQLPSPAAPLPSSKQPRACRGALALQKPLAGQGAPSQGKPSLSSPGAGLACAAKCGIVPGWKKHSALWSLSSALKPRAFPAWQRKSCTCDLSFLP